MSDGMTDAYRESRMAQEFEELYKEAVAEYMLLHKEDDVPPFQEMMETLAKDGHLTIKPDKRRGRETHQSGDTTMSFAYDIQVFDVDYYYQGINKTFRADYLEDVIFKAWTFREVLLTDTGQKALRAYRRW